MFGVTGGFDGDLFAIVAEGAGAGLLEPAVGICFLALDAGVGFLVTPDGEGFLGPPVFAGGLL